AGGDGGYAPRVTTTTRRTLTTDVVHEYEASHPCPGPGFACSIVRIVAIYQPPFALGVGVPKLRILVQQPNDVVAVFGFVVPHPQAQISDEQQVHTGCSQERHDSA